MVVLLHGVLMGGSLWDTVIEGLRDRFRCVVPELPFGAHTTPMPDGADLSLPEIATLLAEFLTELDLHQVTLVCNDWGGAQLLISPGGSDRVANLVLVSCEAFDNYPPGAPGRLLCATAALPSGPPPRRTHRRTTPTTPPATFSSGDPFNAFAMAICAGQAQTENCARNADTRHTQLVWIDDSYTLIPIDHPETLTDHLHAFLAAHT